MRAGFAIEQPTRTVGGVARHGRPSLVDRVMEVLAVCSRACAAAHYYEEHKALSDAALADRGLARADLPRATFDKLAEKS